MPPKKKRKPDALGQPRPGMRDSAYELGGGGGGLSGGGYSPRRAPKLKPSSARPKLKPFQKPSKKLKLPPKARPLTKQQAEARKISAGRVASGKGRAQLRRQAITKANEAAGVVQSTAQAAGGRGKPSFPVAISTRNKIKIGKDAIRRAEGGRRTGYDPFLGRGTGAQTARRRTEKQFGKPVPGSNPQGVKPKAAKKTTKKVTKGVRKAAMEVTKKVTKGVRKAAKKTTKKVSAARAKESSRKSSAKFDAKVKWRQEFYKSRRAASPLPKKKPKKKGK